MDTIQKKNMGAFKYNYIIVFGEGVCKILEIINKLMNFFMNHGSIFLNTAPNPQNIVLMIVEKHILII